MFRIKSGGVGARHATPAPPPGLVTGKEEDKVGQRSSAINELIFSDCRVPASAMTGALNDGFRIAVAELAGGRIGIGSLGLGERCPHLFEQ